MSAGDRHESRVWVVIDPQNRPLWSTWAMTGPSVARCNLDRTSRLGGWLRRRADRCRGPLPWSWYEAQGYKVREITATWRD